MLDAPLLPIWDQADYSTLQIRQTGKVLYVTLDNPPVNALSAFVMRELRQLLMVLRADNSITVIVFDSANPEYFIAHVDMNLGDQMDIFGELAAQAPEDVNVFQAMGELLRQQPQVTIVKLKGIARGGGAEFTAAADMAFAARGTARIGQIESLMGIIPSGGGTQYLSERMGRNRALELVLTGDAIDAETAAAYGWINRAIPDAELDTFVERLARNIGDLADGVVPAIKRIFSPGLPTSRYLQEEKEWANLINQPAAKQLMGGSLQQGAQTPDGERELETLLRHVADEVRA